MSANEEDMTIARVVLAGWRIQQFAVRGSETSDDVGWRYQLVSPRGGLCGSYSTRYGAARIAETMIWEQA